jgi:hypothetical protein
MINPKIFIDTLLILRILLHCEHPVILRGRFRDSCVITGQVTQESKHKLLRWVCIRWICLTDSISLCSWLRLIVNIHQLWLNGASSDFVSYTVCRRCSPAPPVRCGPAADLSLGDRERERDHEPMSERTQQVCLQSMREGVLFVYVEANANFATKLGAARVWEKSSRMHCVVLCEFEREAGTVQTTQPQIPVVGTRQAARERQSADLKWTLAVWLSSRGFAVPVHALPA